MVETDEQEVNMEQTFLNECREKCAAIYANTIKNPKEWFADYLELENVGKITRVYVTLGGPTIWWAFNHVTRTGRLYYHHGIAQTFKTFGSTIYAKLMAFVW